MIYIIQMMILQIATKSISETEFVDISLNSTYRASWEAPIDLNPLPYSGRIGTAQFKFIPRQDVTQNDSVSKKIGSIEITFIDPLYTDEKIVHQGQANITFEDEPFAIGYNYWMWNGTTNFVYQNQYESNLGYSEITCQIDYEIGSKYGVNYFSEIAQEREEIMTNIQIIYKEMNHSKCNSFKILYLQHSTQVKHSTQVSQKIHKQLTPEDQAPTTVPNQQQSHSNDKIFVVLSIISCIFVTLIILKIQQNEQQIQTISITSVWFVIHYDLYLYQFHYNFALEQELIDIIFAVCFLIFIFGSNLFLFFIIAEQQIQRQINVMLKLFFLTCFFYLYFLPLLEEYDHSYSFLLTIGFIMIPQMIHNFGLRTNPTFLLKYIFGFLSIKTAPYIYSQECSNYFSRVQHQEVFCFSFVLIFLIQIYFIIKEGLSKMIQKGTLPKEYNYYYENESQESEECAICLLNLTNEPDQQEQDQDVLIGSKLLMITPCGHKFHSTCLKIWTKVQLTCPYCRNKIPPICQ